MSEDQALALTGALGAMILVGASLLARRVPIATFWRLALLWMAIFTAGFLIVRLFPRLILYFT